LALKFCLGGRNAGRSGGADDWDLQNHDRNEDTERCQQC
jgi:hypothetical protein